MKHLRLAPLAAVLVLAAGCSGFGNKSTEYRTAGAAAPQRPLEVPPELTAPTVEDRFAIPDPKAQTTYSTYSRDRGSPQQAAAQPAAAAAPSGVLPKIEGARLERFGDQRWLVVKGEPASVWAAAREFWLDAGFLLQREIPEAGIMETNWGETRAKIPQGTIRDAINKFLEGSSTTSERDKFRTRLEKGTEPGTTEVFVSHRGMQEVYTSMAQDRAVWQPREADKELEAEMLARMMVRMGSGERRTLATAPGAPRASPAGAAAGAAAIPAANAVLENSGAGPLVVNDGFDRAWRRVGLALDRVGFTVEDRDRSKGVYFVRYVDPESDVLEGQKQSYLEKFMFWKPAPKPVLPQYRILVGDAGASMSQVEVQNAQGAPEKSATGKRILALLYEQLK